ncbi:ABC-2 family transporter protein [Kribbella sp. NPDC051587]|uniref:ABC-2 family transporter protein n=1 Tax=Kribbella sp. NPDC051587 TaxID=3364119 RepID=UPI0037889980
MLASAHRKALEQWTWRSFMATMVINQAVGPLIGLLVWSSVYQGDPVIRRYFFTLLITQLLTVSYEDHTLATMIYRGHITHHLLLPQPVVIEMIGSSISLRFWHAIMGLPIMAVVGLSAGIELDRTEVAAAVPALIVAGAIRFAFTTMIASLAFWTEQARSLVNVANTLVFLLGGTVVPMFVLSDRISGIGQLLPFWSMLGFPSELAAGTVDSDRILGNYAVQAAWLVISITCAVAVWHRGLRRYTAVGA